MNWTGYKEMAKVVLQLYSGGCKKLVYYCPSPSKTEPFVVEATCLYHSFMVKSHACTEPNTAVGNTGYKWKTLYS
jgi:hypothetical protein